MFDSFAFLDLGAPELLLILLILLLLFGSRKLPQLTKGFVDSMRELKSGLNGEASPNDPKPAAKKPPTGDDSANK